MAHQMTYAAHGRALLVLGLPLVGGNMAQVAIGITDTAMLGWYSIDALAAVGLGSSFFFVLFLVGSGFAWAVMPMIAEVPEGADAPRQIRRVTRMGLWLSVGFAGLAQPLFWWSSPILQAMGQDPGLSALAQDYLRIAGPGLIPALSVMLLKSYLAGMERTQVVLWVTVAAALVNVALNYTLIFGHFGAPELGLRGAAVASLGVHLVSLVCLVAYALWIFPEHDLFARLWRPDWEALAQVFRLGVPIGLTTLAEVALFAASQLMMGWLGKLPLAAHVIAIQLASMTFVVHMGLANAATVRVGKAWGRRDLDHLARGGLVAMACSIGFAALTICVFWAIPETLAGWFLGPDDPARADIIAIGVTLIFIAAVFQVFDGAQVVALGLLRGLQDTQVPMIHAAASYWLVSVPACYVLGFTLGLGPAGIWWGLTLGLILAAILLSHRFWWVVMPRLRSVNSGEGLLSAQPSP